MITENKNFQSALLFAQKNNYKVKNVSYNGFILLYKQIQDTKIEIQIYDDEKKAGIPELNVFSRLIDVDNLSILSETKFKLSETTFHHSLSDTWKNLNMGNIFEYAEFLENKFSQSIFE